MSKISTVFRNAAAVILLALSMLFIYKYSTGTLFRAESPGENLSETGDPHVTDTLPDTKESGLEVFLKTLPKTTFGNTVSDKFDYDTMTLSLTDTSSYKLSESFSLSVKNISVPVRIPDEVFGTYTTVFEDRETARPQIELYDGNLIIDRGDKRELYAKDGTLVSDNLTLTPCYLRGSDGNALYTDGSSYFALVDGVMSAVDYTESSLLRAIEYENTADFANESDGFYTVSEETEDGVLVALADSEGNLLTDHEYVRIYAFSEGLAAALLSDGSISYIDRSGNVVFEGRASYRNTSDRYVDRVYAVPDSMGDESVGYLYFDNSIVLVREKIVDYVYKENTISDSSCVLRADGSRLAVPGDYNCISSADGVVVVEKDGRYGVFSSNERWMLQPVYDSIAPYYEGLAVVSKNEKYGLFDTVGNEILPILFDYISPVSGGRFAAYSSETGFLIFEKQIIPS